MPIEIKLGETVTSDAFTGLDGYLRLSGDPGGVLFYGGNEAHPRGRHQVRPWWAAA